MGRILLFPFWSHFTALYQNLVHLKLLNKLMVHFYEQYPMLCIHVCGSACTLPDFHVYFLHVILGAHLIWDLWEGLEPWHQGARTSYDMSGMFWCRCSQRKWLSHSERGKGHILTCSHRLCTRLFLDLRNSSGLTFLNHHIFMLIIRLYLEWLLSHVCSSSSSFSH